MKILITGANGYIGLRLIPRLAEAGHQVVALVRSHHRLHLSPHLAERVQVIEADLLKPLSLEQIPDDIDCAYYLVHSMTQSGHSFQELEEQCAVNFTKRIKDTNIKQIVYLSGLISNKKLSTHLQSRLTVEEVIKESGIPYTVLRAGIIIGSGSASFEIIRDLVEYLPVMVTPKWVNNRCQPISIFDVLAYLVDIVGHERCYNQVFDIGGPQVLTYKQMIEQLASFRGLKRLIINVPVLTPKLSSYWLYFVTSTNFSLASALVDSLKCEAICENTDILKLFPRQLLTYKEAISRAFSKIEHHDVVSSWKDSFTGSSLNPILNQYINVPKNGCLTDVRKIPLQTKKEDVVKKLWKIGGDAGWYYWNWAWVLRGVIDKIVGGVGLRRGRTHPEKLSRGDALDFWRVLHVDKEQGDLLLYAEMKIPGEAWLGFHIEDDALIQTATFRPKGILGRLYWYLFLPFHIFIFKGMAQAIAKG